MPCSNIHSTNIIEHLLRFGCVVGSGDTIAPVFMGLKLERDGGKEGEEWGERETGMMGQHLLVY